ASFADYVFFCNSGAEAMEGAIKTARRNQFACGRPERVELITFDGAFHGRTLSTIAAGGNDKYIEGFGAPVEGFHRKTPYGDIEAVKAAIGPKTAGIVIEPIQGEGGVRSAPPAFFRALRQLCDEHQLMLVFDEVQTGVGRTGRMFAYEHLGIQPDIMAIAKGIGGGFPFGAFLTTREAGKGMVAGTHGTTFGGNPLATAVGNAVMDVVLAPGFLEQVTSRGLLLKQRLAELRDRYPQLIVEVRGEGLMLGLRIGEKFTNGDFTAAVRGQHMLVIPAGDNVVRLLPPLTISESEIAEAVSRLDGACRAMMASAGPTKS
ncbi:MAG: aspartate aminotransferase family protein, partial [Alphaproteobacteria bacterium]|nr:aspartate aminotransferase family protein [Alphaproteobacteria bacterium]